MKEKDLVNSCLELLKWKKIFHYRNNTGAFSTSTGGFYRFGTVGSSDIVAVINGQYIGIECKANRGKLSEAQFAFGEKLIEAGGKYIVVRSLEDLEQELKNLEN